MTATIEERRLGSLRWLVVTGERLAAFRRLGDHVRDDIQATVLMPQVYQLRQYTARPPGRDRLRAVRRATEAAFPEEWAELAALAGGAAVSLDDLALVHFRGDLGDTSAVPGQNGEGCSDLAWRRRRSFIAHNEDGSAFYDGRCALLTLRLHGEQGVTALWYPGMLPSNAFAVTETGLVWSIDHLSAATPGPGAGRHFISRGLQRQAADVEQAIRYLRGHPSAGGFAYTLGDRTGRVAMVETSAGQFACYEPGPDRPLEWHTNHGRYVRDALPNATGSSLERAQVLQALAVPASEPGFDWFTQVLMAGPPPVGAREDPSATSSLVTLCTFVANLPEGAAIIHWRGGEPLPLPLPFSASSAEPRSEPR